MIKWGVSKKCKMISYLKINLYLMYLYRVHIINRMKESSQSAQWILRLHWRKFNVSSWLKKKSKFSIQVMKENSFNRIKVRFAPKNRVICEYNSVTILFIFFLHAEWNFMSWYQIQQQSFFGEGRETVLWARVHGPLQFICNI